LLRNFITSGDCVVDIGANIGRYTLEFSKIVQDKGTVYCFEPNTRILSINIELMRHSRFNNIIFINQGLLDFTGVAQFYEDKAKPRGAKFSTATRSRFLEGSKKDKYKNLFVFKLDDFNLNPNFIKIDVEGSELKVLKGAVNTISRSNPILLIEDNDPLVDNFLTELGYKSFKVKNSRNRLYAPNDYNEIKLVDYDY
jgi:FkbM family methyltransferase